jgi:hypothetical protein
MFSTLRPDFAHNAGKPSISPVVSSAVPRRRSTLGAIGVDGRPPLLIFDVLDALAYTVSSVCTWVDRGPVARLPSTRSPVSSRSGDAATVSVPIRTLLMLPLSPTISP